MRGTFVDAESECHDIEVEIEHLSRTLSRVGAMIPSADSQEAWELGHMCASATEKIYTGCERVMARLARDIDKMPVIHSEGWHLGLLKRMAAPFPGVRGAIISSECYRRLDRLRAFRHRERNLYGFHLDLELVMERSREAVSAFGMFRNELRTFFGNGATKPELA